MSEVCPGIARGTATSEPCRTPRLTQTESRNGGEGPAVSVIVPTAGGEEILATCLTALREQRFADFETIVVDGASSDGTRQLVRTRFPEASLLELLANVGFGAATNAGAAVAGGEYLAFLNSDAEPSPGWLEELVACARRHPKAASVASKILRRFDPSLLDGAGDCLTLSLKAYRRGLGERDERQYETEEEVFSASGTACLWRSSVFRALGGFDEELFAYYEDVDLGFRARLSGFECWYAPRALVLHDGAGTAKTAWPGFQAFHSVRNRWAMIVKDAPRPWLVAHLPEIAAAEALSLMRAVAWGQGRLALRAYADVIRSGRRLRLQRREIQRGATVSYHDMRRLVRRRVPPRSSIRPAWRAAPRERRLSRWLRRTAWRAVRRSWSLLPASVRDVLRPLLLGERKAPPAAVRIRAPDQRAVRPRIRAGGSSSGRVSVLVPTLDGGPPFERLLGSIDAQEGLRDVEIVVVDSGSVDGTIEAAHRAGARVVSISREEFGHGRTRNYAAEISTGSILVLLVQDALLLERTLIRDLADELLAVERVAAVSARQVPRSDADLYGAFVIYAHNRAMREANGGRQPSPAAARAEATVDNVCAAVQREAWEQIRFADVGFAEDLDFGVRALERGWTVRLSLNAAVAHSHTRGAAYHLRRNVADRLYVAPLVDDRRVPRVAAAAIEQLLGPARVLFGELEGAISATGSEHAPLALHLSRIRNALEAGAPRMAPSGELSEAAALLDGGADGASSERLVSGLRRILVGFLDYEQVAAFAAAYRHVGGPEAAGFAAKAAASVVGRAIGDALRLQPDEDLAARLLSGV